MNVSTPCPDGAASAGLHSLHPEPGVEQLCHKGTVLAQIISRDYKAEGIRFFTPGTFSQQLGYMNHPRDYVILPHDHNPVQRTIEWTQETLFVRSGRVRLDIYAPGERRYLGSRVLQAGDIVLLAHGGHGFRMLEDAEMVEVKQGPYSGDADKTRFEPVADADVRTAGEEA